MAPTPPPQTRGIRCSRASFARLPLGAWFGSPAGPEESPGAQRSRTLRSDPVAFPRRPQRLPFALQSPQHPPRAPLVPAVPEAGRRPPARRDLRGPAPGPVALRPRCPLEPNARPTPDASNPNPSLPRRPRRAARSPEARLRPARPCAESHGGPGLAPGRQCHRGHRGQLTNARGAAEARQPRPVRGRDRAGRRSRWRRRSARARPATRAAAAEDSPRG